MGYIAAALNKKGEDVSQTILEMLENASPSPALSYGIADYRNTECVKNLEFTSHTSSILIASQNIFPEKYPPEPLHQGSHSMTFNGILLDTDEPDSLSAANELRSNPTRGIETLIKERLGAFAVAAITKDRIITGIDYIGTIPIYYGENAEVKAIASNRKMLWTINIEPVPLEPGEVLKITREEITRNKVKFLERGKTQTTTPKKLHNVFDDAFKDFGKKTTRATLAFSGGIDSILTGYYLQRNGVNVQLIWTGLLDQSEAEIAQEAANHLQLDLIVDSHTGDETEADLESVIRSIEESDPVKTGIAYPFFWAAKRSYELGYTSMYSGNGADELFAGYRKYLDKFLQGEDPSEDMYQDIINGYLQNFHRDAKTCIDQNIRLLLPFTHPKILEFSLCIPIDQKLPDSIESPRKKILRELAKEQGIPDKLANRPKKAAQYSSGVNKTLLKIAKKRKVSLRELVRGKFLDIKSEYLA